MRNEAAERALKKIGEAIGPMLPEKMGFGLLIFDYGEKGGMFYASSAQRRDLIKAMREFLAKQQLAYPDPNDYYVIAAMRKYGGSFVVQLAELASRADQYNLQRIKDTWPEYWKQHEEMAAIDKNKKSNGA